MNNLRKEVQLCKKCRLYNERRSIVFGSGNRNADIMLLGEAPGETEDLTGLPFQGRSGKLLDSLLLSLNLKREDIYIANIVKCRPPGNRDPAPDEISACIGYLISQIDIIKPKVIVALGRVAGQTILNTTTKISQLRGTTGIYNNTPVVITWHPAYALRNAGGVVVNQMLQDLLKAKEIYAKSISTN